MADQTTCYYSTTTPFPKRNAPRKETAYKEKGKRKKASWFSTTEGVAPKQCTVTHAKVSKTKRVTHHQKLKKNETKGKRKGETSSRRGRANSYRAMSLSAVCSHPPEVLGMAGAGRAPRGPMAVHAGCDRRRGRGCRGLRKQDAHRRRRRGCRWLRKHDAHRRQGRGCHGLHTRCPQMARARKSTIGRTDEARADGGDDESTKGYRNRHCADGEDERAPKTSTTPKRTGYLEHRVEQRRKVWSYSDEL